MKNLEHITIHLRRFEKLVQLARQNFMVDEKIVKSSSTIEASSLCPDIVIVKKLYLDIGRQIKFRDSQTRKNDSTSYIIRNLY